MSEMTQFERMLLGEVAKVKALVKFMATQSLTSAGQTHAEAEETINNCITDAVKQIDAAINSAQGVPKL